MALASGATLAGYTVARRLGSGVTGEVYLAQDPQSVHWVALKVLSPALSSDSEFRRRFQAETPIATTLYHQHIVAVHDRGESDGQLWLAMDYIEGVNAAQLMAERFPAVSPAGEVLAIITAVAEALDYAHQRGLLHRDVKPANILLTSRDEGEQRILLSDFGIAPQLGAATGTDVPSGPIAYAAPEQLTGPDTPDNPGIQGSADQYALAATAFHLLTGAPPVRHGDPAAAPDPAGDGAAPRLSDQRPELARLDGVFSRALAANPADRFASSLEFADAANDAAGISQGDRSPEALLAATVFDYPAYAWLDREDITDTEYASSGGIPNRRGKGPHSAARELARHLDDFSQGSKIAATPADAAPPRRRRSLRTVLTVVAALLVVGVLAAGVAIWRGTQATSTRAGSPSTTPPAAIAPQTTAPAAPVPLDGSYRLQVQRSKQTFNYVPDPQPPDVNTLWAFRSSCTPTACNAVGMLLDDLGHARAKTEQGVIMRFAEGQWLSDPETVEFACVGGNGVARTQTTTQVLSLRPKSGGDFAGELTATVQSNECGQKAAVFRIPTVASRIGEVPPAVKLPDPGTVPSTDTPAIPTTAPSGPGR